MKKARKKNNRKSGTVDIMAVARACEALEQMVGTAETPAELRRYLRCLFSCGAQIIRVQEQLIASPDAGRQLERDAIQRIPHTLDLIVTEAQETLCRLESSAETGAP